jgi:hypothetical protein
MADLEVLALDTVTPQIRAPGVGDGYTFPRQVTLSTGTANGVLYLNASKVATSGSALAFDGTNLSIANTVAAGARLSIADAMLVDVLDAWPSATYDSAAIVARTGSLGSAPFNNSGSLVYRTRVTATAGRSSHIFYTGSPSAERLRIDETGNVGIGTSSPQAVLDLGSATGGRALTWSATASARFASIFTAFSAANIVLGYGFHGSSSADSYLSSWTGTLANAGVRVGSGTVQFFTNTATAQTAGNAFTPTERMRITSAGELLLGQTATVAYTGNASAIDSGQQIAATTAGAAALSINRYGNVANGAQIVLAHSRGAAVGTNTIVASGDPLGIINFNGANGTGYDIAAQIRGEVDDTPGASADMPGRLTFYTTPNASATPTERMRITSAGNVKIGGTADRATTEGTAQLVLFNGTAPVGTLANGVSFYSAAGEANVMDAAGNATLLSPHDAETNEWIFRSKHTPTGKVLKIDVEKMLRFINEHFGLNAIHEFTEE